ncbi:MAG TPA: WecB/TagA/CpsF family glycosyltransferase [Edaphobacter sp.]|jgi:UDP-N-acetyl-D-mannosaminuronic acid transferase (WecB/TagA/CpsF family)|nr:WecB/TagA/CpsF family glycosyltransferase [Edaphobacter sp.]
MTQETPPSTHRILGIDFFDGSAKAAVDIMRNGGLLVVPAAPALKDLDRNHGYRDALLNADLVLADSAFMVLIWNRLQSTPIKRLSGLEYLRELLQQPDARQPGNTFWIMASPASAQCNLAWLQQQGITVPEDHIYMAPIYGSGPIADAALLDRLNQLRPHHVVITVGGGTQERLGLYLKRSLNYRPAIHCIGAAIAFLSGDQVRIPVWADRFYLGWLLRSLSEPKRFVPRYFDALRLYPLMRRYRDRLPSLKT